MAHAWVTSALLALVAVTARASSSSTSDWQRALQTKPSLTFIASHLNALPDVLNHHLRRHAERHGHTSRPCDQWTVDELNDSLFQLLKQGEDDHLSQRMQRLYSTRSEPRKLRFRDVATYMASWHDEQRVLDEMDYSMASLVLAGKCYESSMLYTHGLSSTSKQRLLNFTVPLIPEGSHHTQVQALLAGANTQGLTPDTLETLQDQVVW